MDPINITLIIFR